MRLRPDRCSDALRESGGAWSRGMNLPASDGVELGDVSASEAPATQAVDGGSRAAWHSDRARLELRKLIARGGEGECGGLALPSRSVAPRSLAG